MARPLRSAVTALVLVLLLVPAGAHPASAQERPEIVLSAGDLLRVEIWREEDLSGEFLIDPDGDVTLPLIGPQPVTGVPWTAVRERLMDRYLQELRNPSITLTPLRRVYVLGSVRDPGLYTLDPTLSLAGAVALAGGAGPDGDLGRLRVVRAGETILDDVAVESDLMGAGVRSGDQVFVGRRGWLERNTSFLITAALSLTGIIVTLASG